MVRIIGCALAAVSLLIVTSAVFAQDRVRVAGRR